jgi:hypothetical protein
MTTVLETLYDLQAMARRYLDQNAHRAGSWIYSLWRLIDARIRELLIRVGIVGAYTACGHYVPKYLLVPAAEYFGFELAWLVGSGSFGLVLLVSLILAFSDKFVQATISDTDLYMQRLPRMPVAA